MQKSIVYRLLFFIQRIMGHYVIQRIIDWIITPWNLYQIRRRKIAVEKEIKKAKKLSQLHGCKYLVINWQGKPRAIPKWLIKKRIAMHKFAKGTTIQDFEKNAMYITH